jgi:transitional endoplasmic reticulum ATPase
LVIVDEADSPLGNRAGAVQRWDLTPVNAMLRKMEARPLPLACTTNLLDRLDPAASWCVGLRVTFPSLDGTSACRYPAGSSASMQHPAAWRGS